MGGRLRHTPMHLVSVEHPPVRNCARFMALWRIVAQVPSDGFPPVPAPEFTDPPPGYAYVGEKRTPASYSIPQDLKQRLNGAVRYASDTGDVPQVESQTDLVRVAAHRYVAELERQHNGGAAFPSPSSNARGRGPDHSGTWIKVGVTMPVSLHQRILGAARFADDTDLVPGVTSANRLVATALDGFLTELEREHNHGRPFKDPRRRLPGGRTPTR